MNPCGSAYQRLLVCKNLMRDNRTKELLREGTEYPIMVRKSGHFKKQKNKILHPHFTLNSQLKLQMNNEKKLFF